MIVFGINDTISDVHVNKLMMSQTIRVNRDHKI